MRMDGDPDVHEQRTDTSHKDEHIQRADAIHKVIRQEAPDKADALRSSRRLSDVP